MAIKRSFTIVSVSSKSGAKGKDNIGGTYISSTPSAAASKAGNAICRKSAVRGQCTLTLCIEETTKGSSGKQYTYVVKRSVVNEMVEHNGVQVLHKYKTTVKKA